MTLKDLSELVGISPNDLSRYENGHSMPAYDRFIRIARTFNKEPGRVFTSISKEPQ